MGHFSFKWYKTVLLGCLLLFGIYSCKDDYTSIVPYVPVNMSINPTNFIEFCTNNTFAHWPVWFLGRSVFCV